MTKEELNDKLIECYEKREMNQFLEDIDEFFSKNVVISKEYNGILPALFACKHASKDIEYKIVEIVKYVSNNGYYEYHDIKGNSYSVAVFLESIKPKEPVYEALVRMNYLNGSYEDTKRYFTFEEFKEFGFPKSCEWVEETKRERK